VPSNLDDTVIFISKYDKEKQSETRDDDILINLHSS